MFGFYVIWVIENVVDMDVLKFKVYFQVMVFNKIFFLKSCIEGVDIFCLKESFVIVFVFECFREFVE